jgi:hypothetical protein
MSNNEGFCPHCLKVGQWQFGSVSVGFPPTGGDYEWAETDTQTTCPHCQQSFSVRVRVDLDDFSSTLIRSPWPQGEGWAMYVVANVTRFAKDMVSVKVMAFSPALATAQEILNQRGGSYGSLTQYDFRGVLKMTPAGYKSLAGKQLHRSASEDINYA